MRDQKVLKNKAAWVRWTRETALACNGCNIDEPVEYPCIAYTMAVSYNDQLDQECYLYEEDLQDLLAELRAEK